MNKFLVVCFSYKVSFRVRGVLIEFSFLLISHTDSFHNLSRAREKANPGDFYQWHIACLSAIIRFRAIWRRQRGGAPRFECAESANEMGKCQVELRFTFENWNEILSRRPLGIYWYAHVYYCVLYKIWGYGPRIDSSACSFHDMTRRFIVWICSVSRCDDA